MSHKRFLLVFTVLSIGLIPFQNCAPNDVEFSDGSNGDNRFTNTLPGDPNEGPTPIVTPPDPTPTLTCVQGRKLGVWLDPDNSGDLKNDNFLGDIVSYKGSLTAAQNYNYYSASAHPVVGPAPSEFSVKVFFYEGADGLSLSFFYNVDDDSNQNGSADNKVNWDVVTSGNGLLDNVLLSDDSGELKEKSAANGMKKYEGRFQYWYNTDGGVIGPFAGENYKVQVKILQSGDNNNAAFFSANGAVFSLKDHQNTISSFIIAYRGYEDCQ
jgi:hypothetical protein